MAPSTQAPKFDRPLPFESLHLGKSILGKKKKKISEHEAGGSEKLSTEPKEKAAQPMPPWFLRLLVTLQLKNFGLNGENG